MDNRNGMRAAKSSFSKSLRRPTIDPEKPKLNKTRISIKLVFEKGFFECWFLLQYF